VTSGGWRERTAGHYLHVTSALASVQEWLIVSDDLCVSVMADTPPYMREFG